MELSALEKLDIVLRFINDKQQPPKSTLEEIKAGTKAVLNESDTVLLQIIGKLKTDGNIKIESGIENVVTGSNFASKLTNVTYYLISFEGAYLLKYQNGYVGREKHRHAEEIRVDRAIAYQREQTDTLNRLTSKIARGTIGATVIGGLLLIWQIVQYFLERGDCPKK